jgi:glycerol-3-phosphate acyltransferase PlsY
MATLLVVAGYLLGSIPFGLLLARRVGVDVRRLGTGNIGATNVARNLGARLGAATLLADAGKGAAAVLAARAFAGEGVAALAGMAAVIGHAYPVTLRFAGGKGVATALGAVAALAPPVALAALAAFALAFAVTGRVSVASMSGALVAPAAAALLHARRGVTAACLAMAVLILLRHRENLARLRRGTEPRFVLPKRQAPPRN